MIKLLELNFVGIGRFTTPQTIVFSNRNKLIQIDGKNKNTGGSSGSGKSTIFNALDYNLGLSDIPNTILQSRITKTSMATDALYEIDGVLVRVKRSKKDGLSLAIGEEMISGNIKLAEERLEQLIGIPLKLFKKMIHKKQKEGGFFLKLTAKESFDFLIKVLGLEHWTTKIEKIDKEISNLSVSNNKLLMEKESISAIVSGAKKTQEMILKPILDVNPEKISIIQNTLDVNKDLILIIEADRDSKINNIPLVEKANNVFDESEITELNILLREIKIKKQNIQDSEKERIKSINLELDFFKKQINRIDFLRKDFANTVNKIKSFKEEKEHIEAALCPTCTQKWLGDLSEAKLLAINNHIKEHATKAYELKTEIDTESTINNKINELQLSLQPSIDFTKEDDEIFLLSNRLMQEKHKQSSFVNDIDSKYHAEQTAYQLAVITCKSLYAEKLTTVRENILKAENEKHEISTAISNYNTQLENYEKAIERSSIDIVENNAKLLHILLEIENNDHLIKVATEAKRLIKNYTLQVFQESLDYIGDKATEILSKIPNMSSASIYFEGCKEGKNGNIRDEVNPIVNLDGENEIPFRSLSGGEETAIDLAVDLAVIDLIENKLGKGADFLILDEPFNGLDSINSERVMDMLIALDTQKHIILVDHSDVIKAMIDETITVIRDREESVII